MFTKLMKQKLNQEEIVPEILLILILVLHIVLTFHYTIFLDATIWFSKSYYRFQQAEKINKFNKDV